MAGTFPIFRKVTFSLVRQSVVQYKTISEVNDLKSYSQQEHIWGNVIIQEDLQQTGRFNILRMLVLRLHVGLSRRLGMFGMNQSLFEMSGGCTHEFITAVILNTRGTQDPPIQHFRVEGGGE